MQRLYYFSIQRYYENPHEGEERKYSDTSYVIAQSVVIVKRIYWLEKIIRVIIEPAKATGSIISPLCVRPSVRHELISETAPRIFPKLGMKLGDNKGKKIAESFFENYYFAQKRTEKFHVGPKLQILGLCEIKTSQIF